MREIPAAAGRTLSALLEVLNDLSSGLAAILRHRDGASVDGCHAGVTILFPSHSSGGEQATVFPLLGAPAIYDLKIPVIAGIATACRRKAQTRPIAAVLASDTLQLLARFGVQKATEDDDGLGEARRAAHLINAHCGALIRS